MLRFSTVYVTEHYSTLGQTPLQLSMTTAYILDLEFLDLITGKIMLYVLKMKYQQITLYEKIGIKYAPYIELLSQSNTLNI